MIKIEVWPAANWCSCMTVHLSQYSRSIPPHPFINPCKLCYNRIPDWLWASRAWKYHCFLEKFGDAGYRSRYLSHAKRALYHLSYTPLIIIFCHSDQFESRCIIYHTGNWRSETISFQEVRFHVPALIPDFKVQVGPDLIRIQL